MLSICLNAKKISLNSFNLLIVLKVWICEHSQITHEPFEHLIPSQLSFSKCFTEFTAKIFVITVKGLEPATSCVRDHDATTAPRRHTCEKQDL